MSYQPYVDNLVGQQCVKAGIFGLAGEAWHDVAQPSSINASAAEVTDLIGKIRSGPGFGSVTVGGDSFSEISSEKEAHALLKCKSDDKDKKYLCYAAIGKSFVMIALRGGAGERGVMGSVEDLKDYLNANI